MANFKHKVDIKNLIGNDDLPFQDIRDNIVVKLRESALFPVDLIEELEEAEDEDEFDEIMNDIYDFADENMIWLGI